MKRIFNNLICAILVFALMLSLGGCMSAGGIEDTNGEEDLSLQTITDKDIIEGMGSTRFMSSSSNSTVNGVSKSVHKAKTMSGVLELYEDRLKNETLDITVSCEITKGNARLVLIVDGEIVHDFDLNGADQSLVLDNVSGNVSLKIAGESAGYAVSYTVK